MKYFVLILTGILISISLGACRKDFNSIASSGDLRFSKDTVFLDTIFTNIGSSTYNLKVYNHSSNDIHIPTINLARGENSNFRLLVDGITGKSFENIEIKANDSLFIFVETTVDILDYVTTATEFLYKDSILFDTGINEQNVKLITLVKDATFIFPETIDDEELNDFYLTNEQLNWTNEKPYVIYGYPTVPSGETLIINPGARIHFHRNSGLIVSDNASIQANGDFSTDQTLLENEIIFEGDRLEPSFSKIPGQWGTIWLQDGSVNNSFNHTTIKNATIGLRIDGATETIATEINNTQLYNHSISGIFALNGHIIGKNIIVNNCGQTSVALTLGGNYTFTHCTFTNYWNNSFRAHPTLSISNYANSNNTTYLANLTAANFINCIIYGSEQIEFNLLKDEAVDFNYKFSNCLFRFEDINNQFNDNPLYDFNNTTFYEGNILNQDPLFLNVFQNNFSIPTESSPADNNGLEIPTPFNDILNTPRDIGNFDIGAYQAVIFTED